MSDKVYVGRNMSGFDSSPEFLPYSRVLLWLDDETAYEAGETSGRTLEASLPWATQEIANQMLAQIKGFVYRPFTTTEALVDPAAEIGDGITVNGLYSVLASADVEHDGMFVWDVSAPNEEEINSEYPYLTPLQKEVKRNRSLIEKNAEEIRLSVSDLEGSVSELSVKLNNITLSVSNGYSSSTIRLMAGETEISSANISLYGVVTFTALSTSGTTTINGDNITTGTIEGRTLRSILDAYGNVGGEIEMCYLDNTAVAGGIRLDDEGAGTAEDRRYRMFLYTKDVEGIAFSLKLQSASGMSLEAMDNIYASAGTVFRVDAPVIRLNGTVYINGEEVTT